MKSNSYVAYLPESFVLLQELINIAMRIFLFFSFVFTSFYGFSQQFTQEQGGRIVATRSDSRSVNFLDINNDGWEDVFISNGLQGGQNDLLYINDGTGRFTANTDMDITNDGLSSVGASFADIDNDGDIDGVVTNWYGQRNGLYINNGSGRLELSGEQVISKPSHAESAAWGDFDNDGLLDLYVANSASTRTNPLFKNKGNGIFEEVIGSDVSKDADASRSVNWVDVNNDGLQDLYVGNENNTGNKLHLNLGNGKFGKEGIGGVETTFGSSFGDIDNDGDFDLFLANTNIPSGASNQLLRNDDGDFNQIIGGTVDKDGGCSIGSAFGDYDNDGDLDLIVTNGFCNNPINFLYENLGDGEMVRRDELLTGNNPVCSYGTAWGDINNDGFLDLMIANCKNATDDPEPRNDLYINNGNDNHWIKIKLEGTESNRDGVGSILRAKATIDGNEVWQSRHVSSQTGYSGQNSLWVHFGVADALVIDSLIIKWTNGNRNVLTDIPVDQHLRIQEKMTTATHEIKPEKNFQFTCWPNPVSAKQGQLIVGLQSDVLIGQRARIVMTDVNGRNVFQKELKLGKSSKGTQMIINLENINLNKGTYILSAQIGKATTSKKILVY